MKNKSKCDVGDAIVVALGSNLRGDHASCRDLLEAATGQLPERGVSILDRSGWWRSAAWPRATDPDYLNGVALVETALEPRALLAALLTLEQAFGRRRGDPNSPRPLDLDLIAYGRVVVTDDELILPHPRAAQRRFVMGPLAQIAPDWVHPVSGKTAASLATDATVGRDAEPI